MIDNGDFQDECDEEYAKPEEDEEGQEEGDDFVA